MISLSRLYSAAYNNSVRLQTERRFYAYPTRTKSDLPRVLFCPSEKPTGASLLRAYNIAEVLPDLGWIAACMPALVKPGQRARLIQRFAPDLIVLQQCRHILNDAALLPNHKLVLDTDDADFHLTLPGLLDRLERTSQAAKGVITGSRYLQEWHAARCAQTCVIWTGGPVSNTPAIPHNTRKPVLAWAQAKPLSYTQELAFVVALHRRLRQSGSGHTLRFYGIDTKEQDQELRAHFDDPTHIELRASMPYSDFLTSLQDVAVGLSPIIAQSDFSRGKSFGKVLGYLDAMVPVVASDEADHRAFFTQQTGVISNDPDVWHDAVLRLLSDPQERETMAVAAFKDYEKELSTHAAARKTDLFLRSLL